MIDEVFVGRRDELARFAVLLGELSADRRGRIRGWRRGRRSGDDPAEATRSRVVLVHGLGGSGKSRLLRKFRGMADESPPNIPVLRGQVRTVWLDWEDEQRDEPASYASAEGPSLVTVLDAVQRAVIEALGADARAADRARQAFAGYRQGAARMPEYAARFADVIAQTRQAGSAFTSGDAAALLKSLASAGMVGAGHPGGFLGLTPDQLAASAQAAGHLSEAATRAMTGKKAGEISPEEYDLVTDPARELTRRAAAALRTVADQVPLVILLDTGEVIGGRAWGWLRRVMTQTGPQVIWMAGARFETEAEAGVDSPVAQFVRDIGDEHLVLMSPTRFDDLMIRDYLQSRIGGRSYTDAQIDTIARFTRGLPLAVSFTAALLDNGHVQDVCQEMDDRYPSSVVSQLARRYLIHAEQQTYPDGDPRAGDVKKILGLALAFGDLRTDPDLLAALWDVPDPLAAFQDLARRHDFVLPLSRRLHDDVRDTLRTDLLDPYRRARVREISQRALGLYSARLAQMRSRWPALDDQLSNAGFTTALLAMLWHTFWADNQAGLDLLTEILPVLAAADRDTAEAAAAIADRFASTFSDDQRHDLNLLTEISDYSFGRVGWETAARPARRVRLTMPGLVLHPPGIAAAGLMIGELADRQAAVMILQARLQAGNGGDERAITHLRTAAARTASTRLRQVIGSEADTMAGRLIWPEPGGGPVANAAGLAAAKITTETLTDSAPAWFSYAVALTLAGRSEEALAACDQAIALDPDHEMAHGERGVALQHLGRPGEALAACDQAIALDPGNANHHNNRGYVLQVLGRSGEALADYDQAIALDPGWAPAHRNRGAVLAAIGDLDDALAELDTAARLEPSDTGRADAWAGAILWHRRDAAGARERFARVGGQLTSTTPFGAAEMEAVALCGLGRADAAEQHLLDAVPRRVPEDRTRFRMIYDLLSDPPLPGIERLRAIVDSRT